MPFLDNDDRENWYQAKPVEDVPFYMRANITPAALAELNKQAVRVIVPGEFIEFSGEVWIPARKHEQVVDKVYELLEGSHA